MSYEDRAEVSPQENRAGGSARRPRPDRANVIELIEVLSQYPGGLRRWSVMRAIRKARENAQRDIPQKLEDDVERTFRTFCTEADPAGIPKSAAKDALFYRPKEKAGEVWAVFPEKAKAWLDDWPVEGD